MMYELDSGALLLAPCIIQTWINSCDLVFMFWSSGNPHTCFKSMVYLWQM